MKTVYFVRHGESEGNVGDVYQSAKESLTENGKTQAQIVADRCLNIEFKALIASTMARAMDTAAIIGLETGHTVESSELFCERIRPTELQGKSKADPVWQKMEHDWWESLIGHGPRVGDGENFDDMKERARKAFEYLQNRSEESMVVVTHGVFMRMLVAYAFFGENLTPELFKPITRTLVTRNTGIMIMRYKVLAAGWEPDWSLLTWNDHAHLA